MQDTTADRIWSTFRAALHRISALIARNWSPAPFVNEYENALASVTEAFGNMTEVPYRVINVKRVDPTGTSRQIYRLFEAVQLCAEWRFHQPKNVCLNDVLAAFDAVAADDAEDRVVFPDGNISPAAQRIIRQHIFFAGHSADRWAAYCEAGQKFALLVEHEDIEDDAVSPIKPYHRLRLSPLIRYNRKKGIWDVAQSSPTQHNARSTNAARNPSGVRAVDCFIDQVMIRA